VQEPFLFPVSLAENICLRKSTVKFDQIEPPLGPRIEHEFICKLPAGYDTPVGELWGPCFPAARSKIPCACSVENAPILILDGADERSRYETEKGLLQALRHMTQDALLLSLPHRLLDDPKCASIGSSRTVGLRKAAPRPTGCPRGIYARSTNLQS